MSFLSYLINGISLGSVYAIIALGYTMVYGIARMLNFAHGDIIMVGGFVVFTIVSTLGLSPWLGLLVAVAICTVLGIVIEKVAYCPLRGASSLAVLITAIGVSYLLQNVALLIFGSNARQFTSIINLPNLKLADGSLYRDKKGMAWVNPYKQEMWDYLVDVGIQAHQVGFDEIQFDYIRFSTEKGIGDVVYDEADVRGRDKKTVITEFVQYASEKLKDEGAFVAADVFGAVMGGGIDSDTVGQSYGDMANQLDYICPMIYPSHYSSGNFGLEHPDMEPYKTIFGALQKSGKVLLDASRADNHESRQAIVRPWLQDFTATYLGEGNYITYGATEVAEEVRAVQDAGYEEWMLWSAANKYHLEGLSADGSSAAAAEVSTETSEEGETAVEDADGTSEAESAAETAQQ